MPIGAYLDGQKFDGETIRQMGIAFELALASFHPAPRLERPPSCRAGAAHHRTCERR